jgi:hypothetical protein
MRPSRGAIAKIKSENESENKSENENNIENENV